MSTDPTTAALILEHQRFIDVFLGRQVVEFPAATRVLVVAPHPDDALLGPGGTTLKYTAAGVPVHWVCITDGRACVGDPRERARLASVRADEERACAAAMGLPEPELYDIPEDRFTDADRRAECVERLRASVRRVAPDAIFVPYMLETHPLHRLTTHLLAEALRDEPIAATVYNYAVASFPLPGLVVDISAQFARKQELCAHYASQLALRDYAGELELLNGFFAAYAGAGTTHAELFFPQDREAFVGEILGRGLGDPATLGVGIQPLVPEDSGPA